MQRRIEGVLDDDGPHHQYNYSSNLFNCLLAWQPRWSILKVQNYLSYDISWWNMVPSGCHPWGGAGFVWLRLPWICLKIYPPEIKTPKHRKRLRIWHKGIKCTWANYRKTEISVAIIFVPCILLGYGDFGQSLHPTVVANDGCSCLCCQLEYPIRGRHIRWTCTGWDILIWMGTSLWYGWPEALVKLGVSGCVC